MARTVFVAAALLVGACTHQRTLTSTSFTAGDEVVVEVAGIAQEKAVVVDTPRGAALQSGRGYIDPSTVTRVTTKNHAMGAAEGLALGGVIGIGIGASIGFGAGDDRPCPEGTFFCWSMTAGEKATLGAIALGSSGALVGVVIGAIVGTKFEYTPLQRAIRVTPSGPPGSQVGVTVEF